MQLTMSILGIRLVLIYRLQLVPVQTLDLTIKLVNLLAAQSRITKMGHVGRRYYSNSLTRQYFLMEEYVNAG